MVKKEGLVIIVLFSLMLFSLSFVSAVGEFWINGTVKDTNGNLIPNATINITVRNQAGFSVVGTNSNMSNGNGVFEINVSLINDAYLYEISIVNTTTSTSAGLCNLRSKSLPAFPKAMTQLLSGTTFYLSAGGNINLTAVNSNGARANFTYQIKDQKLGYPIAEEHTTWAYETVLCVPSERNYSIMLYPYQSMPVSFSWDNFTSAGTIRVGSQTLGTNLSYYNATTKTLNKQFNLTMGIARVIGYVNYTAVDSTNWTSFSVIAHLFEGGNMIHTQYGLMPANLSSVANQITDWFNVSGNGFYNITVPTTVETSNILFFATGMNGSVAYGSFKNISPVYGTNAYSVNFSMYGLLGNSSTITQDLFVQPPTNFNSTTAKRLFTIVNASNSSLASTAAHIEVTVDYSAFGLAGPFTWMVDISQSGSGSFYVPLLNLTGVKEMNVFVNGGPSGGTGQYAPKRKTFTVNEILANSNITISTFNPGAIDNSLVTSSISMTLYLSNSSCDVPNPPSNCIVGGSGQTMASFNPMQAVMGGGKLSFRMGYGGILVHYVNVDMMASGPPDASFDSAATTSSAGGFASAMRFGSQGPTVYDYVLVSIPYSDGPGGLKDNVPVNLSIPVFYDDSWNVIWNVSANGSGAVDLAGNYSHYSTYQNAWANLTIQKWCTRTTISTSNMMNETDPCAIDTGANRIWVRLPHFSGAGPSVNGNGSGGRYTNNSLVSFLSPTPTSGVYLNVNNLNITINVTSNLTDFSNLTIYVFNHSSGLAGISLNLTRNSSDPTYTLSYFGLPDGMWSFNATAVNSSNFKNSTEIRNVTIDTTLPVPIINVTTDTLTADTGRNFSRNWIYLSVNVTEINKGNVTFYLYNATAQVYANLTTGDNSTINWTGLPDGTYTYNASFRDKAGNSNSSVTRTITLDTTAPSGILTAPANASYLANGTAINFSANLSDNLGIMNTTLYIYNQSSLYNQSFVSYVPGTLTTSLGIVVNLIDNVYNWFYQLFDWTGNSSLTGNNTLTIDTTFPVPIINVTTDTLTADTGRNFSRNWIYLSVNVTEINKGNVTFYLYNATAQVYANLTTGDNSTINWTGLPDGTYTYNASFRDKAGNSNSSVTRRITLDTTAPVIEILSPLNNTNYYANQSIPINFRAVEANILNYWYYVNNATGVVSDANVSFTLGNLQNLSYNTTGWYNLTFYANDTTAHLTTVRIMINITTLPGTSFIANASALTINATYNAIVVPYNTSLQNVTVANTSQIVALDLSQNLNNGTVTAPNNFSLINQGTYNYTLYIPQYVNITGFSWNGTINIPIVNASTSVFTAPGSGTTNVVVNTGYQNRINFTSPVKIIIGGMTGKSAAWSDGSATLNNITTICNNTVSPTNVPAAGECYNSTGSDLIIWTYHLTTFAAYTPATAAATTTTTTSSSGSGSSSSTTYEDLAIGVTKTFSTGDVINFKIDNKAHTFRLIYVKGNNATIQISSAVQQATIPVGEEKSFDITGDGKNDITVKVNSVSGATASITLKLFKEETVVETPKETPKTVAEKVGETVKKIEEWSTGKKLSVIIALIIIIAAIVFVVRWVRNRR